MRSGGGRPYGVAANLYADCNSAVALFQSTSKTASIADQDLIAMDIGLFEIYEAYAADAIPMNGRGNALRLDAKRIWKVLAVHGHSASLRRHATVALRCFFENSAASCKEAFSASPEK
jgi:hypothetical protein